MTQVNIGKTHPAAYKAMMELNARAAEAASEAGLSPALIELVKIRASQLNGCAFCLKMHTADAIAHDESWDRLAVLPAWRESQYFTPAEQAALQIAESVTRIGDHPARAGNDIPVEEHLSSVQISAVTWLTVVINSWNRIAISSHYPVAPAPVDAGRVDS